VESFIDHSIFLLAGILAIFCNKQHRYVAAILFVGFSLHDIFGDLILKVFQLNQEAAVYIAYAAIQVITLLLFNWLKVNRTMKALVALNLIVNSLVILHYVIVTNFGEIVFDFHTSYNPIVWSLMLAQLLCLLWIEKDVVILIREQGRTLRGYCSISSMVRNVHSNGNVDRCSK